MSIASIISSYINAIKNFRTQRLQSGSALDLPATKKQELLSELVVMVEDTCDGFLISEKDMDRFGLEPDRHYKITAVRGNKATILAPLPRI